MSNAAQQLAEADHSIMAIIENSEDPQSQNEQTFINISSLLQQQQKQHLEIMQQQIASQMATVPVAMEQKLMNLA